MKLFLIKQKSNLDAPNVRFSQNGIAHFLWSQYYQIDRDVSGRSCC